MIYPSFSRSLDNHSDTRDQASGLFLVPFVLAKRRREDCNENGEINVEATLRIGWRASGLCSSAAPSSSTL
jgi:hypothetical protein